MGDPVLAMLMEGYLQVSGGVPSENQARAAVLLEHVLGSQGVGAYSQTSLHPLAVHGVCAAPQVCLLSAPGGALMCMMHAACWTPAQRTG